MAKKNRGKKKKGYRQSVYQDNSQNLPAAKGWIKKRSPQGLWQRRWFTLNNHYLVYYKDDECKDLRGSIDLMEVADARVVSRFGDIELVMSASDVYPLKCVEERQSALWVQAIKARIEHYSRVGVSDSPSITERPSELSDAGDLRDSVAEADHSKEGWLLKQSPARHNKFQERYVRLGGGALQYFKKISDQQPQGVIPLDNLSFVRAFDSDPSCITFEVRYEDRTFVFNAQTHAEMMSWVRAIERQSEEARQQTETAKQQAILMTVPFRVRYFDEVGSDEFVGQLRQEVLQLFTGSTVPETIQSLNQALDMLEDLITDCELVRGQPVRSDIMTASLHCVHDCMEIHLSPLLANAELSEMTLEDLYHLIDWIGAHHAQIRRFARHIPQADLPHFAIYNDIPRLCQLYLHGPKGSSKMLHDHVQRILSQTITNRQDTLMRKEDGKVFTHAPIDIWEMLHQHISLATNTQSETLHVLIIHEIGQALTSVAKTLEEYLHTIFAAPRGNQQHHQQDEQTQQEGLLEFLCAIANDMVMHTTEIAEVVAEFEADELKDKLDESMDGAVQRLLECGQLAITKLARFVMLDTENMLQAVYTPAWLKASNMDVVGATAQDYLNDLTSFLSAYWSNKMINTVLLEVTAGYATAIATKARSFHLKPMGGVSPQEAIAQLCLDIETFRGSFGATVDATIVEAHLIPLQDIATILSAPTDELPSVAAGIAARGMPLDTLVVKVIHQLYPLRDDAQRRNKSEREKVIEKCNAHIDMLTKSNADATKTSVVFGRAFDVPTQKLLVKLTRTFSARSDSSNRPSSPSRDSIDSDQQEEGESNKLLNEILELARKTDGRVEGATSTVPFQTSSEDPVEELPNTRSLRTGVMHKLSKRHVWIVRWFDLLAVKTEGGESHHVLGWSKKQSQQEFTASCLVSDITRIAVLQSSRPLVYVTADHKMMLKTAAPADKLSIDVVAQGEGAYDPNSAQGMFDFTLTVRDRAEDMILRVRSVDDLVEWINLIADVANLVYDTASHTWLLRVESPKPETGFNPKARMKNRVKAASKDVTKETPPNRDDDGVVVSPFHNASLQPPPPQSPTTSHSPNEPLLIKGSSSSHRESASETHVRVSDTSTEAFEKFSISISSEPHHHHEDDGHVVEVKSSWCCWK